MIEVMLISIPFKFHFYSYNQQHVAPMTFIVMKGLPDAFHLCGHVMGK